MATMVHLTCLECDVLACMEPASVRVLRADGLEQGDYCEEHGTKVLAELCALETIERIDAILFEEPTP